MLSPPHWPSLRRLAMPRRVNSLIALFAELRRRRVVRSAGLYLGGAFLTLSAADVVVETYRLPDAVQLGIGILVILGFPVALVVSWKYDWSDGRLRRARPEPFPAGVQPALVGVGLTLAVVISVAVAAGLMWPGDSDPPPGRRAAPSLAILPFERVGGADSLSWLAPALEARLEDALSGAPALRLRSRRAVAGYRNAPMDSLAAALDLDYVVEAQVVGAGAPSVVIQLVDARTGTVLGSGTVRSRDAGAMSLLAAMTDGMEEVLRPALGREIRLREWRAGTDDARAFQLRYRAAEVRATAESRLDVNPELALREMALADSLLAESQRRDPDWAEVRVARAELADRLAVARLVASRGQDRQGVSAAVESGIAHADAALALRPGLPEALGVRGRLGYRKARFGAPAPEDRAALVAGAESDLRAALAEDNTLAQAAATLSGVLFWERSDYRAARWFAEQAYRLDAYLESSSQIIDRVARSALELGDDSAAVRWCRLGVRRFPDKPSHHGCVIEVMAWGDGPAHPDTAWHHYRELLEGTAPGNAAAASYYRLAVAAVLARAGRQDSALSVLEQVRAAEDARPRLDPGVRLAQEAAVCFRLGQTDRALRLWERLRRTDPYFARRAATGRALREFLPADPG